LAEVISGAMYWQPPHGGDIVAGAPEVRQALIPFAETILDTGLLDGWSRPLDRENQWALAWDDSDIHGTVDPVFAEPLGEVAEGRVIALDGLIAGDDDSGSSLSRGLNAWVAEMNSTETERRHDFAMSPFHQLSSSWWSTPPLTLWTSTSGSRRPVGRAAG
jgi:hypothetical protein